MARSAKLPEKLRILELAQDVRSDVDAVEPLVDASAHSVFRGLQEHGSTTQRLREAPSVGTRHALLREERDAGLPEEVIVGAHFDGGPDRCAGQDDVEALQRKLRQELLRSASRQTSRTFSPSWSASMSRCAIAFGITSTTPTTSCIGRFDGRPRTMLPTEGEDLVGVAKHRLAHLGRKQAAARATQQLFAQRLFQ